MGRMKSLGCILSFGIFFWVVATALAEPPAVEPKIPPPIQRFSWTGFYAGGNLGGTWSHYRLGSFPERVDLSQQFDQLFPFDIAIPTPAFEPVRVRLPEADSVNGSFFGGGQVGYNMQWNHLVVGLEGDFDGLSTSRKASYSFSRTTATRITSAQTNGTATREGSTDWNASVRIRVGYTYDRWLLYLTGGPAFADITGRADDIAVTKLVLNIVIRISADALLYSMTMAVRSTQGLRVSNRAATKRPSELTCCSRICLENASRGSKSSVLTSSSLPRDINRIAARRRPEIDLA